MRAGALGVGLVVALLVVCVSGGSWQVTNLNFATIATATSFTSAQHGLSFVGVNGEGSFVWETTDGGNTWNPVPAPQAGAYLGGASQGGSAVAASFLNLQFSASQPYNFSNSINGGITSQSVEAFTNSSGASYGAAGETILGSNGVGISEDSGLTFSFVNISALRTDARYGSFPTPTTWYISAGEWPDQKKYQRNLHQLTARWQINYDRDGRTGQLRSSSLKLHPVGGVTQRSDDPSGWKAQIVKTTDGGNTWRSVYYDEGNFYFNQISCSSASHCAAVGESDSSAKPGVRIFTTVDGGNTWNQVLYNNNPAMSLMAARMLSDSEIWAAGGLLDETNFNGYFYHSTDGGKTWTANTVSGVYGNAMTFPTSTRGFATAFNFMQQSAFLSYA